jgi:hypothetical protein
MMKTGRDKHNSSMWDRTLKGKDPRVAYLFGDGTALFIFEMLVKGTTVRWANTPRCRSSVTMMSTTVA